MLPTAMPFLAKFAKRIADEEAESTSSKSASRKGTRMTKIRRETTDDQ